MNRGNDGRTSCISEALVVRSVEKPTKPIEPKNLKITVKRALEAYELEMQNARLVVELQKALKNLQVTKITNGVHWLQIPEENLYILCAKLLTPYDPCMVIKYFVWSDQAIKYVKNEYGSTKQCT